MNAGSIMIILGANTAGLTRAVRDVRILEKQVMGSISTINTMFASFGRALTQFVSIPMGLIGVGATRAFSEFEFNLAKITGLVGIATEQTKAWGDELLDYAGKVGKAPKELSDSLYYITSSGFKGAEAMDVLKISAQAAAVGLGETKAVADVVTSALNAYGKANITAAQATDILVMTVREGKGEPDEMVRAFATVIPVAAKVGLSFDQVGAAMAAMTRLGTSSATSAVYLRQMLFTLLKPTQKTEKALQKMNTSSQALRDSLRNEGLLPTLEKLGKLTEQYGETMMGNVFPNIRAFMGVIDLLGENLEDNKKVFEVLANSTGALDVAIAAVSDTFKYQWNQTISQGKVLLVQFGEALARNLLPVMNNLKEGLKSLGEWFDSLNTQTQNTIVKIGGFVIALGPALLLISSLRSVLVALVPIINGMGAILVFVANAVMALSLPLKIVIMALVTLSMVLRSLKKHSEEVKAVQNSLNKVYEEGQKSVAKERIEIEKLLNVAKSEYTSKAEKEAAIKRLNEISPEYLGFINEETIATQKATDAINNYLNASAQKAEVMAINEKLEQLQIQRIELLTSATAVHTNVLENMWLRISSSIKAAFSPMTYEQVLMDKRIKMGNKVITVLDNEKKALEERKNALESVTRKMDLEAGYENIRGNLEGFQPNVDYVSKNRAAVKSLQDSIKQQMIANENYTKFLAEQERDRLMTDARGIALREVLRKAQTESEIEMAQTVYQAWVSSILSENEVVKQQLQQRSAFYNNFYNQLELLLGKVPEITPPAGLDEVNELWEDYNDAVTTAAHKTKLFSDYAYSFEYYEDKLKDVQNILEDIAELKPADFNKLFGTKKVVDLQNLEKWLKGVVAFNKVQEDIKKIQEDIATDSKKAWNEAEKDMLNYKDSTTLAMETMAKLSGYLIDVKNEFKKTGDTVEYVDSTTLLYNETLKELKKQLRAAIKNGEDIDYILKQITDTMTNLNNLSLEGAVAELLALKSAIEAGKLSFGQINSTIEKSIELIEQLSKAPKTEWTEQAIAQLQEVAEVAIKTKFEMEMRDLKQDAIVDFFTAIGEGLGSMMAGVEDPWKGIIQSLFNVVKQIGSLLIAAGTLMIMAQIPLGYLWAAAGTGLVALATMGSIAVQQKNQEKEPTKMAAGGVVPPGFPNDTFPAMLTSGEIVVPKNKTQDAMAGLFDFLSLTDPTFRFLRPVFDELIARKQAKEILASAPKMSYGGIVPSGYQNDSYPAMLSSGEVIIPPKRLPEFERDTMDVNVVIEGVVRGKDIYYVTKEVERKYKNSF